MAGAAPTASSTKETTNYARLCRLLVDVGTQALRGTFDDIHAPKTLHTVLARNKTTLQSLRARKIINATQWEKLFPAIPNLVSSREFDITLLMVLFRNICGLPSPTTGWDTLPAITDVSREADIVRVKCFRNTVYAHAEHASIDDATFSAYWQKISGALVRLGGVQYRAAIDNLETECMDPEIEDHYKELISQYLKDEKDIKHELKEIGSEVKNVRKLLDNLQLTASNAPSTKKTGDEGKSSKLEKSLNTSIMCGEKYHENEPLDYYCQNCKVCICYKCGQTRHTHHTKVGIQQAADQQKLKMVEVLQEMKEEIAEREIQIEKMTELLRKSREKIAEARNKVLTTVEELTRVLKEHGIAMVTKLDILEEAEQRRHAIQQEHFKLSVTQLKASSETWEAILERNINVEILQAQQDVTERHKGLLHSEKIHIYKALHVRYETNEEEVQRVRRAVPGHVVIRDTDPLQSVATGKGLKEAEVGRESNFTITTKDSEGRPCCNDDDQITVKVQTPTGMELCFKIEDKENGEYIVSYRPDCDGHYNVAVAVNGYPLTSSPWSVHVSPHRYQTVASFGSRGKGQGQFENPCDIAVSDKTGNVAVADAKNNRVQLFSSDGSYLTEFSQRGSAEKLIEPISVTFTRSGDVIIIDCCGMYYFAESGHFVENITNEHLNNPRFLTVACDGRLVVSDWGNKSIKVLSSDGKELIQSFSAPDCNEPPLFVAYHEDTFFVSYGLAHVVKVFGNDGVFLYDIGSKGSGDGQLCYPTGIAIDKFNNLIVCDSGNSRLQVFALDGKFVNTIKEQFTGLKCAGSVAVSTTGQLFVTDFSENCVHVLQ
ncbi:hypothetical protein ACROYT_G006720 [Oculina patagonica]